MPYGYIKNLIDIPRNLDASGIIIDPSNILFGDGSCRVHPYMKKVQEKIIVKVTTAMNVVFMYPGDSQQTQYFKETCNDNFIDINVFKNTYVLCKGQIGSGLGSVKTIFIGVIKDICCVCDIPSFNIELFYLNNEDGIPQFGIPYVGFPSGSPIIENAIGPPAPWQTIVLDFWGIRTTTTNYISANASIPGGDIKSMKVIQGDPCSSYSLSYNNQTKQNYMYCLQDKTRKINFTKNRLYKCLQTNNPVITCLQPGDCTGGTIFDLLVSGSAGTITYRVHTFTYTGSTQIFTVNFGSINPNNIKFDWLGVGGGGGGGWGGGYFNTNLISYGGGGGGGGMVSLGSAQGDQLPSLSLTITIGKGGEGGQNPSPTSDGYGNNGENTIFDSIVDISGGGGGGIDADWTGPTPPSPSNYPNDYTPGGGISDILIPLDPFSPTDSPWGSFGYTGGAGGGCSLLRYYPFANFNYLNLGEDGGDSGGGNGANGTSSSITGTSITYGSGGGGSGSNYDNLQNPSNSGSGGTGAGNGAIVNASNGVSPGSGGGGSFGGAPPNGSDGKGGNGADGVLIIRYPICI